MADRGDVYILVQILHYIFVWDVIQKCRLFGICGMYEWEDSHWIKSMGNWHDVLRPLNQWERKIDRRMGRIIVEIEKEKAETVHNWFNINRMLRADDNIFESLWRSRSVLRKTDYVFHPGEYTRCAQHVQTANLANNKNTQMTVLAYVYQRTFMTNSMKFSRCSGRSRICLLYTSRCV